MARPCVVTPMPASFDWSIFDGIDASEADVIIVEDSDEPLDVPAGLATHVISRSEQRHLMPRVPGRPYPIHSAAVRNFGHLWAYKNGYDPIIALDYDCRPDAGWVEAHLGKLSPCVGLKVHGWLNPIASDEVYARGFPYEERDQLPPRFERPVHGEVKLCLGLWTRNVDLYGTDRLTSDAPSTVTARSGGYLGPAAISGMNVAFRRELVPAYFFLPDVAVGGWQMSRHDDIWGGYVLTRLMALRGDLYRCDGPVVEHLKQTPISRVLALEHFMHILTPHFVHLVESALEGVQPSSYEEMFATLVDAFGRSVGAAQLPQHYRVALVELGNAMTGWVDAVSA
jgi:hypothetical protein